jgi:hypothetical protein
MPLGCDALGAQAAFVVSADAACQPPIVRLPQMVKAYAGVPVTLSVPAQPGVTYGWTDQLLNTKVGVGPSLTVTPPAGTQVYKVWARNACGTSSSTERVVVQ